MIAPVFGWKKPDGFRKIQEVYEEIGSGNAKSTLGTALALYCLCADGQMSARVICVAGSREQAGIIFNATKMMVKQNEALSGQITILRNSVTIESEYGLGILKAISADSDTNEGLNPTAIFFDELHVQPNSKLYNNLKKNFPKRKEPLLFIMTTAGVVFTFAHEYHLKACKIRDGLIQAPGTHVAIYEADKDGDDFDEEQWKKANPGWDYLNIELLRAEAEDAKKSGTALSAWRRYHLNKWVNASSTWLSDDQWMKGTACTLHDEDSLRQFRKLFLSPEALKGRSCVIGLDLSSKRDTSAATFIFPPKEDGERVKVVTRVYIPELSLYERAQKETPLYVDWQEYEDIVVTTGEDQDQDLIYEDVMKFIKAGEFKVMGVAYDSWNAGQIISLFEKAGIETKAYKQDYPQMNMPMGDIQSDLSRGKIEHGGHPVLRWHCSNTEVRTRNMGGADYKMPTKSTEIGRIDSIVATIIAYGYMIFKMKDAVLEEKSMVKKGMVSIKLNR